MENSREARSAFNDCVELKEVIQQDLRQSYKGVKKLVRLMTNIEENDFKFIVDMYHYRKGGYPQPTSDPKHTGIIKKFVSLIKYFDFLGLDDIYDLKEVYGIEVIIHDKIEDYDLDADSLDTIREHGFQANTFKEFLWESLLRGDSIQCSICEKSDLIKESAVLMEETAKIKKKHFSGAVGKEVQRLKALREEKPDKLAKINEDIDEEFTSYENSLHLLEPVDIVDEGPTASDVINEIVD